VALLFSLAEIKGAKTMKSKIKQLAEDQRRSFPRSWLQERNKRNGEKEKRNNLGRK